jgi:hypothetical protein
VVDFILPDNGTEFGTVKFSTIKLSSTIPILSGGGNVAIISLWERKIKESGSFRK